MQKNSLPWWSWGWVLVGLGVLWAVGRYGWDVVFWDEIRIGEFVLAARDRGWPLLGELWAQHNESRKFFPRLLIWAQSAVVGTWHPKWFMVLSVGVIGATAVMLAGVCRGSLRGAGRGWVALLGGVALFSTSQYSNLLWGIQFITFVPLMCLVAGVRVASAGWSDAVRCTVCGVLAVVATLTYANGLVLWVLLGVALWFGARPVSVRWIAGFLVAGVMVGAAYFVGFERPSHHPKPVALDVMGVVHYASLMLGNGPGIQGGNPKWTAVFGGVVLLGSVGALLWTGWGLLARPERGRAAMPWALVIGYSILSVGITAVGRYAFGLESALSERYHTFALPALVGLGGWVVAVGEENGWARRMAMGVVIGMVGVVLVGMVRTWPEFEEYSRSRRDTRIVSEWIVVAPNPATYRFTVFPRMVPDPREVLRGLGGRGLLPFGLREKEMLSEEEGAARPEGSFDVVQRRGRWVTASGWAVLPGSGMRKAPDAIVVGVRGEDGRSRCLSMTVDTRRDRPDVTKFMGALYPQRSGWLIEFELPEDVREGALLTVWALDFGGDRLTAMASRRPLPDGAAQ